MKLGGVLASTACGLWGEMHMNLINELCSRRDCLWALALALFFT